MWATRYLVLWFVLFLTLALAILASGHMVSWWWAAVPLVFSIIGVRDVVQRRHAVLRNYPLMGHFRFMFEAIRPELRQYFFEGENDGAPFTRKKRSVVYQRAKPTSTAALSVPNWMSKSPVTNGSATRCRQPKLPATTSAWLSAKGLRNRIRCRSSTSRR